MQHDEKLFSEPLIGSIKVEEMITHTDEVILLMIKDYEFDSVFDVFKYKGVIGLDLNDKSFLLKQRILGVEVILMIIVGLQLYPCAVHVRENVQVRA